VPKVASNYSTINGGYGAIAAVSETQDDDGFVPITAVNDCLSGWPTGQSELKLLLGMKSLQL
jgi:hypothetical protein